MKYLPLIFLVLLPACGNLCPDSERGYMLELPLTGDIYWDYDNGKGPVPEAGIYLFGHFQSAAELKDNLPDGKNEDRIIKLATTDNKGKFQISCGKITAYGTCLIIFCCHDFFSEACIVDPCECCLKYFNGTTEKMPRSLPVQLRTLGQHGSNCLGFSKESTELIKKWANSTKRNPDGKTGVFFDIAAGIGLIQKQQK